LVADRKHLPSKQSSAGAASGILWEHCVNIIEPFLYQCRNNAHVAALCVPGAPDALISYGRLARQMHNVSRTALRLGLARGNIAAVFVNDPILHTAIILGLTRLGVITLSGRSPNLPKELPVDALITDSFFPYQASRVIRADPTWIEGDGTPLADHQVARAKPDDICRIVLTSGTTGDSKGVAITHRMLWDRIARHNIVFGPRLPQCSRTFCDMGFATSLGYQFLIYTLWRGGTLYLTGTHMDDIARAFETYGVQNVVTSPAGLAVYLRYFEERPAQRCNLEMILTAGSLLSTALATRTRRRLCSNVMTAYGATETSMIAGAPAGALGDIPGAVGHVMPDQRVEIVDNAGQVVPPGTEGVVRVSGPYNIKGYIGDPEESATTFRGDWFYPGDLGRLTPDLLLMVSGREKTVMNLGGDKIKPELVEEVLKAFPGLEEAGVFSVTNDLGIEEIWSLVVARAPWDERTLRTHCEDKLPVNFVPRRFIAVEALPKNAMGKIERRDLPGLARSRLS
jgi:acyl-coenzyme A synthetase/AMP-(fatty) acid ligase